MSRRDLFHQAVVHALEREGWTCACPLVYDAEEENIVQWIE